MNNNNYIPHGLPSFTDLLRIGALALVYALLAKFSLLYLLDTGLGACVWFPGGLGAAALLIWGTNAWPGIMLGSFAVRIVSDDPVWVSTAIAFGNTLESLLLVKLLSRNRDFSVSLTHPRDYLWLVMDGAASSWASAAIGPTAMLAAGLLSREDFMSFVTGWWMGDTAGIALVTPAILVWRQYPEGRLTPQRMLEILCFLVLSYACGQIIFLGWFQQPLGGIAWGYWMFIVVAWGAVRFGRHGVSVVILMTSVQALIGAAGKIGYLGADLAATGLLNYWLYLLALSCVGITLALIIHERRQLLQTLQESERFKTAILNSVDSQLAVVDMNGVIVAVNESWRRFARDNGDSTAPQTDVGANYLQICRDSVGASATEAMLAHGGIQAVLTGLRPRFSLEYPCFSAQRQRWFTMTATPMESGRGAVIMHTEITTRIQVENALREQQQLLTESQRLGHIGSWSWNTHSGEISWTEETYRIFGVTPYEFELNVENSQQYIHPEDCHALHTWMQHCLQGKQPPALEFRIIRPDGEIRYLYGSGDLRAARAGSRLAIGTVQDITKRKQFENALQQRQAKLAAILESSLDAVVQMDAEGNITGWNSQAEKIFGWSKADALGRKINETIIPHRYRETHKQGLQRFLQSGIGPVLNSRIELYALNRDGCEFPIELSIAAIKTQEHCEFSAFVRDISERRCAEELLRESEERWKFALEGANDGVWDWDIDSNRTFLSSRWKAMLGFSDHEIGSDHQEWISRIHPDDKAAVLQEVELCLRGESMAFSSEHRLYCKDGSYKWVLRRGMVVSRAADGRPLRMIGTHTDISERKRAEESLRLAALVYENSSEAMAVTDAEGSILAINPAFTQTTGYTEAEIISKNPKVLSSGRQDRAFYQAMWHDLNTTGRWRGEIWNRRKNGEIYPEELSINTIFNPDGTPWRRVALFYDITQKKASEEQLWRQANFDPLTGLPNRQMFHDRLSQEIKKAHRAGLPLGLILLDLDRFKEVNDGLGHEKGDDLLQEAARRLTACVRESDTVARLGGDEFTIILGEPDVPASLERVAKNILNSLAQPFRLDDDLAYISASIGITIYPDDASKLEQLLKNADQAMYAAKNLGRNRFSYFTPAMQEAAQNRLRLAADLRQALAGGQFHVYYQPIVELASGSIHKAEALLRWLHPVHGPVSPESFIPLSEDIGLIDEIGDWVFQEAARQVSIWRTTRHPEFQISVNKSPAQFRCANHTAWLEYLRQLGLPGQSIVVEITEGLLLDADMAVKEKLFTFRDAGLQVAIDDFGTGYSSLAYLRELDIDYLKIDKTFIRNLASDNNDFILTEAIILMAHKLGLKVIAEGVETQQQRDLLIRIGCDYGQGYLFSAALTAEAFEKL